MKKFINTVLFEYLNEIEKQHAEMQATINPIKRNRLQNELLTKTKTYTEIKKLFTESLNTQLQVKQEQYRTELKTLLVNCPSLQTEYNLSHV